ncbi:MAG: DMT family transporter [Acutalibacteraceae bacterium]|nr:DMT family transporter [Acutalibacteraceae bacterium]
MKTRINYHFVLIFLAAALWGTAGLFVRTAGRYGLSEMQLVLFRTIFSTLVLGIILIIKDRSLFKIKIKDLWLFIAAGILSIVLFNFCYYKTMSLTSLSVAAVLLYTAPFFVVIMSVFIFKQRLTLKKCAACVTAFVGCCLVTGALGTGEKLSAAALIFGLLTGFGYSLYTVFSRLLLDRGYNSYTITFYTFTFAFFGCIPFTDFKSAAAVCVNAPAVIPVAFLMAVLNTVLPYLLYTTGLCGVDASIAPIIAMVEPVVATLIGAAVYGEALTLSGIVGILIVLLSVFVLNYKGRVKNAES